MVRIANLDHVAESSEACRNVPCYALLCPAMPCYAMLRAISVWVVFKDASNTVFPTIWDYAEPSSFRVIFSRHHAIWLMVLRNLSKGR